MAIPAKWREGNEKDLLERFDDPELGDKIRKDIQAVIDDRDYGKTLRIARFEPKEEWQGKLLGAVAEGEKMSVLDLVVHIQRQGGAQIVSFGMKEEEVRLFMKEPYVATASDGTSMMPAKTVPHPRSYGCFPRKIGFYSIAEQVIPVEKAIRSATGLPADILELPERGYLKVGYHADIVVLDPKTFRDKATFDDPHQYATGVRYLFVNGQLAIDDGKRTEALTGKALRHQSKESKKNS